MITTNEKLMLLSQINPLIPGLWDRNLTLLSRKNKNLLLPHFNQTILGMLGKMLKMYYISREKRHTIIFT